MIIAFIVFASFIGYAIGFFYGRHGFNLAKDVAADLICRTLNTCMTRLKEKDPEAAEKLISIMNEIGRMEVK